MMRNADFWTKERSLQLIEQYRLRPVLWDVKDPMYQNKTFYEEAWLDISNIMKIHSSKCIIQMKNLLETFMQNSIKVTAGGKTSWFAWNALSFIEYPDLEKLTLLTGNYYYDHQDERVARTKNAYVAPTLKNEILEGLDEDSQVFMTELAAKLKKYQPQLRSRVVETVKDVIKIADEENPSPMNEIDLTDD